jgi:hypothetical protein
MSKNPVKPRGIKCCMVRHRTCVWSHNGRGRTLYAPEGKPTWPAEKDTKALQRQRKAQRQRKKRPLDLEQKNDIMQAIMSWTMHSYKELLKIDCSSRRMRLDVYGRTGGRGNGTPRLFYMTVAFYLQGEHCG